MFELLVVFAVLGVLLLIAIPQLTELIERSRLKATHATALTLYESARLYRQIEGVDTVVIQAKDLIDRHYVMPPLKDGWQRALDVSASSVVLKEKDALDKVLIVSKDEADRVYIFECDLTSCKPSEDASPGDGTPGEEENEPGDDAPPSEENPPGGIIPPDDNSGNNPPRFWDDPVGWLRWWLCRTLNICF
ncbi:MAG: hypothetical protein BSOLF_1326 [Candidatus Carbobacillus altaicus]|uniref:Type IV pilin PilA n=1 Tax=Candidatus Carbonibacillus altaicus TaxID=2163959 RepID=A0A2R6XZL6_9BACL|nr:MAG: hypothetical protein BSOLF_1326 [Candidatus Carbobacillus altaicus]